MASLEPDVLTVRWLRRDPASGRAMLRAALASQLGIDAGDVPLVQSDAHAKPRLGPPFAAIDFNWSHTGCYAVVAIGRKVALGVDIELATPRRDPLAIARRFFAPAEVAVLAALAADARAAWFARLWTVKEAVLKATGDGIANGLDKVVVGGTVDSPRLLAAPAGDDPAAWQLRPLATPWSGVVATLAWRGAARRVVVHPPSLSSLSIDGNVS